MEKDGKINLKSLFDLSEKLNSSSDIKFIFNSVLLSLMGKTAIGKGAVFIPEKRMLKPFIIKGECSIIWAEEFQINSITELEPSKPEHSNFCHCGYHLAIPIKSENSLFGIIFLGKKITGNELSEFEIEYIKLVSTIASIAINNSKNYSGVIQQKIKAEQKNQLLETLFSISKDFSLLLSKEKILQMLTYSLMGQLMVNKFGIILKDSDGSLEIIENRFYEEPSLSLLKRIERLESCESVEMLNESGALDNDEYNFLKKIGASVLSPMQVSGKSKGWLVLGNKLNGTKFTSENFQFIEAISNTAITALENERLVQEEIQKKQLENEMNLALEIQKGLLPKSVPTLENYDLFGISVPSRSVGGDYFDYLEIDEDRILMLIADVSGKGLPAAMIMANLQSGIRLLSPKKISLNEIVNSISKLLYHNTSADKFVTMFIGELNLKTNKLTYINAGHNPPYLLSNGIKTNELKKGGLILGLLEEDFPYETGEVQIESGDMLFLYTDGITENKNSTGEEYGEARLEEFLTKNHTKDSQNLLNDLINELKIFSYGSNQYDDITAINLKMA